jgi:hypothetical protein
MNEKQNLCRNNLTPTGLLMEGVYAQMYGPPPDCKRVKVDEGTVRANVFGL